MLLPSLLALLNLVAGPAQSELFCDFFTTSRAVFHLVPICPLKGTIAATRVVT